MRAALLFVCTLLFTTSCDATQSGKLPRELAGSWVVRIENLQHQVVVTMNIVFTNEAAESCMSGDWKRVIVKSHQASEKDFFPFNEPLSYELEKGAITIGRNEICDAYLHLKGDLRDSVAEGEYVAFGMLSGERLGYFSLRRSL